MSEILRTYIVSLSLNHLPAAFASKLSERIEPDWNTSVITELHAQVRGLPLSASSITISKRGELDKLGTDLWNLSTRLRRDDSSLDDKPKEVMTRKNRALCLLRAFAFLLLASAGGSDTNDRQRNRCVRLIKIAMKAAKVCIEGNELTAATKVMEQAAEYQEVFSREGETTDDEEIALFTKLRSEYFAVRMALVRVESWPGLFKSPLT